MCNPAINLNPLHLYIISLLPLYYVVTRVLRATFFEGKVYVGQFVASHVFNEMLVTLFILNVMWTVSILRLNYEQLVTGKATENVHRVFPSNEHCSVIGSRGFEVLLMPAVVHLRCDLLAISSGKKIFKIVC